MTESKGRILVVDDDPVIVDLLRTMLEHGGYEVTSAHDGPSGLEAALDGLPDVVLLDIHMPGMDGFEVCKGLKEDLRTELIPVIMVTAKYLDEESVVEGMGAGAHDYLAKPFKRGLLMARVDAAVRLRKAHEEVLRRERLSTIGSMTRALVHDLQAPLGVVLNYLKLLASDRGKPEQRKRFAVRIERAVNRMVLMAREVGEFAHGLPPTLDLAEVELDLFVKDEVEDLQAGFGAGSELHFEPGAGESIVILDRTRIARALSNLVGNARDAVDGDGGSVVVSTSLTEGSVSIEVQDDGPGFEKTIIERVFEPLVTHGKPLGTGLGMALARQYTEAHGGTITAANSRDTGGAVVTMILPEGGPRANRSGSWAEAPALVVKDSNQAKEG